MELPRQEDEAGDSGELGSSSSLWPKLIIAGFVLVILVNVLFIYIAVSGADEVVPSYLTEER